ncbi:Tannase and feruloyl esterase [Nocardioides sp. YR527]|uniref:tannase/feruloyl esterase family alpha/beta hydrolase n=1 Tax=Nocardioides sp. YR527 TaxID=1881028 RepID=UPI00087F9971|nr:tannase/feruloyl esterase family alpha/beta hydrolase [Nocardioides sp. YR527]SDK04906.1 Tannase and feruloyl esterase [Nocardioides sp. YR527]
MKRLLVAAVPLVAALTFAVQPAYAGTNHHDRPSAGATTATGPGKAASECVVPDVSAPKGARVVDVTAVAEPGGTLQFPPLFGQAEPPPPVTGVPAFCQVQVTLTHGRAGDRELIEVWLPATGWTGRFQALGGSGYLAGGFGPDQANAIKAGYAVGTTDAGATPTTGYTPDWALTADGQVNRTVLENFAERGPHELAVVGKAVTRAHYGRAAAYSYWNGCSTGGRQGYMEAQRHPGDFDGVLANAPAISWDRFAVADLWPIVVQNELDDHLTKCEFDAFTAAAVAACDGPDTNGVIEDPSACDFDAKSIVGRTVLCDGEQLTLTATDAEVVNRIWDGPRSSTGKRLWYGLAKGADLSAIGTYPFPVSTGWVASLLKQDPAYDLTTITQADFEAYLEQSVEQYHDVIASDDADLSGFRRAGGKLLTWHGLADQLVPVGGSIRYHDEVEKRFGRRATSDFYRLFLVPGAAHCGPGAAPAPADPLGALVSWVEEGKAPRSLS